MEHHGIVLPPGVTPPPPPGDLSGRGTIVNETDLPDHVVREAVATYFDEHASVLGVRAGSAAFSSWGGDGSLLARTKYRTPGSVIEEIMLARDLADRDDDVAETIGAMIATAYVDGFSNTHEDEVTVALYDEIGKFCDLDMVFAEMYRELLIASSVTTAAFFTRDSFQFQPAGADRQRTRTLVAPKIGVLPAEQIRVLGNDLLRTGRLAYLPATGQQEMFLAEFFSSSTTAARKAEMRAQEPVLTRLLVERLEVEDTEAVMIDEREDVNVGSTLYRLNPTIVARSTFPKGAWKYPRPLLTRNFALLEAKRLLNIMDYALLQGGSNFLVVAKKGSDKLPAIQEEVDNLRDQLRRATRTGVIIGDHRLGIEIITPNLTELLNAEKRRMLGRKIAQGMLRLPEMTDASAGAGKAVETDTEVLTRVIAWDRDIIRRHVQRDAWEKVARKNTSSFSKGPARLFHHRIMLQGMQAFTDGVLKSRDRGDISRKTTVQALGLDYDGELAQRRREKAHGDDRVLTPPPVPFTGGGAGGPNDNGGGRPPGSSSDNGRPGAEKRSPPAAAPTRVVHRNAGETIRAMWDEENGAFAIGELTYSILAEFIDTKTEGRITPFERGVIERLESEAWPDGESFQQGPLTIVPVNPAYDVEECRAVRLTSGVSILVGRKVDDGALVARALCFREPEVAAIEAEATAWRWGFLTAPDAD